MTAPLVLQRLPGVDLARFVALAGMVLVHAQSDLVLPRLEAAAGDVEVAPPAAAAPLELLQAAFTDRARLLFLLLAGVGVGLLAARRGVRATTLLRRAGFLLVLGALLVVLGWGDLVLLFYAVLFVLAPGLLRLQTPALLVLAVLCALPALLATAADPTRTSDLTGVLLVLGEAVPLFCVGIAVGRADLGDPGVVRRLAVAGALLAAPGLLVLALRGALDLRAVGGPWEQAAATSSTTGLCLLAVAACLHLSGAAPARTLRALAVAGGMPLTAYVGHALLFPPLAGRLELGLGAATAIAVAYLAAVVLAASAWRRRHRSGPVEAAMRWVSG